MKKIIKGYKFIRGNMKSKNGDITWKVGEWQKHEGEIELCKEGLHFCRTALQSLNYIYGDRFFLVEARGKIIEEDDKVVCSEMRLTKEIPLKEVMILFARRCADRCKRYISSDVDAVARVAANAAYAAAYDDAARAAAYAADAAYDAADAAGYAADAVAAERKWQEKELDKIIRENMGEKNDTNKKHNPHSISETPTEKQNADGKIK